MKIPCNFKGQKNRGIVSSVFQGADGLPGDFQDIGQFFLLKPVFSADFFQPVFQEYPSLSNVKFTFHNSSIACNI